MCNMALKLPWYDLLTEKPIGCYFKFVVLTIRRQSATREHLFLYPQGDRLGLRKPKKTSIAATTSVHLPKPVSNDLAITSDSVLTNPKGKDGVQGWSV